MAILGEVFSIIRNGASIKQIDGANGFPITRIETISNRVIDRNRLGYANVFDITEYESYVLQSGDILMSHINSEKHLGKTALYIKKGNEKIIHGMNLLMLRANSEVILPLYAKYFFDSNLFLKQIPNITKKSVNQASFTVTALKKLEIKIPQMVEQKRIIDIMSRLDNIIQYRKDQLEKLDLFVKSRFIELFGDPVSNTKNIPVTEIAKKFFVTKLAGFEYTKYIKYQDSGDVIMVRGLNVKDKKLKLDDVYYIDSEVSDKLPRSQLKENDIVMTYVGVNIGDVALVDAKNKYHLAPNVAKISPYDINETNPVFFVYLLAFNKENFAGNATNTAKQALNMEKIRKLQIILPKIELQNQFADFVAQVDKSKLAIQQSLDELETLKKSLMQQYFG